MPSLLEESPSTVEVRTEQTTGRCTLRYRVWCKLSSQPWFLSFSLIYVNLFDATISISSPFVELPRAIITFDFCLSKAMDFEGGGGKVHGTISYPCRDMKLVAARATVASIGGLVLGECSIRTNFILVWSMTRYSSNSHHCSTREYICCITSIGRADDNKL